MRLALALAALAAAVVLLRRRIESNHQSITFDADDSEVVGMPTTLEGRLLGALGLDPDNYTVEWREDRAPYQAIDWNRFFTTGYVDDPDWRN